MDEWKYTPLHHAAGKGHTDVVKFLSVAKNCNSMSRTIHNDTPLHLAVLEGHMQVLSFFIDELKCPPDIIGQREMTPLQMANKKNHSDIAQYLHQRSVIPYISTSIDIVKEPDSGSEPCRSCACSFCPIFINSCFVLFCFVLFSNYLYTCKIMHITLYDYSVIVALKLGIQLYIIGFSP